MNSRPKLNYIFMGSPPLAVKILERLVEKVGRPVAVVTQQPKAAGRGQKLMPTAVQVFAEQRGLPTLATPNINLPANVEYLQNLKPDVSVVAAFGQILREPILNLPRLFSLNVHASLLPKYRGAAPVQRAILDGETETGITIQKMARKLDTGDILLQKKLALRPGETSGQLMARLAELGCDCMAEALASIQTGVYAFTPQDHAAATYAAKLDKADAPMDWTRRADELLRQVWGLQPWPVAETKLGKDRLKIFRAQIVRGIAGAAPGTIATDHRTFLHVQCGDGQALSLTEIQLENRKKLLVSDFLLAFRGAFPYSQTEK